MVKEWSLRQISVKYRVIQFPDGEPHIILENIDRKDDLSVTCRVQDLIKGYWGDIATPVPDFRGYLKVYPDRGALQRYSGNPTENVICSKVRDPRTGQLSGFKIENPEVIEGNQDLPLVVIDDLCDGGGTFKGIAQLLESHYPNRDRVIYVTHMVNPKGIATLSENYKEVYFTNSYRDWEQEALPDNVKVIKVV